MAAPRKLNRKDMRTLGLASLGGALEYYDFILFLFFTRQISATVLPAEMSVWLSMTWTYGILAAGYFVRPVGGIVMAHLGDRIGRKRVFTFSVMLMAVATFGMALIPSYAHWGIASPLLLLLLRMMQGLAVGGEVPGAWTFVAEHVPARFVGFATGVLTSGLSLGILIGSLVAFGIRSTLSPEAVDAYGWRCAFILGGVFGFFAVYLRRWLEETPIFKEMKQSMALAKDIPLKIVLRDHMHGVMIAGFLTWTLSAVVMISTLLTPEYLQGAPYHYGSNVALAANCVTSLFLILGTPIAGLLCDRIGSGRFFAVAGILFAVAASLFYSFAGSSVTALFILSAVLGFFAGFVGAVAYVMVRAFPAPVRFSGLSFSYNVSYAVFGGLTPFIINLLRPAIPMIYAWYLVAIAVMASIVGVYLIVKGEKRQVSAGIEEKISRI